MIQTRNPATAERLSEYEAYAPPRIDALLDRSHRAFDAWARTPYSERSAAMLGIAALLRDGKTRCATMITTEMGKPIVEAEAEIEKCALSCEHYADRAQTYLAEQSVASNAARSYVAFRPLGVLLAIMPWNYPFWQVFRAAVPALMAGNVLVLKHAGNVTGCALEIERLFSSAGFPDGVFSALLVAGGDMERIVADPRIAAVTLTGSDAAGSAVAAIAGKYIKKTVLELGGSDAFVVLADADAEAAAQVAVRARFQNAGQSCIAAKRFIIEEPAYERFIESFVERTSKLAVGDPLDRATQVGPLARPDLRDEIERQVNASLAQGAKNLLGVRRLERAGYYYAPTVVSEVRPTMPLFAEESFGPAASVTRARDAEHAVELANASSFGLGGSLWTRDLVHAEKIAARLESGAVFINGMTVSDPRLPFGGVKRSGYGRELSHFGIQEFVNAQTVWIAHARAPAPS
jgi:acyl-CoA reductase-like NAD-dependent aldehyde dehydrogenase